MPIIKPRFLPLTGVPQIDQHHKHLVQLLNEAYDDFREGAALPPSLVDELLACCSQQFSYEEGLMAERSFPKQAHHRDEHATFMSKLLELKSDCRENVDTATDLLWFLCGWATHHLRESDAELAAFLQDRPRPR